MGAKRLLLEPSRMHVRRALDCRVSSRLRWDDIRRRVKRRLAESPVLPSLDVIRRRQAASPCNGEWEIGGQASAAAALAGSEVIRVCVSGCPSRVYTCADRASLREWYAASLVGGTLRADVVEAAGDGGGAIDALVDGPQLELSTSASGAAPTEDCATGAANAASRAWLLGEIDASAVRILHARTPVFPRVLEYAQMLERQARTWEHCGTTTLQQCGYACPPPEGPPRVQISWHPLMRMWVVNDGAHRTYAARLAGVPLAVRWKRKQLDWDSLNDCARSRLRHAYDEWRRQFGLSNRTGSR